MCCYFNDIIKIEDFDPDVLTDIKSWKYFSLWHFVQKLVLIKSAFNKDKSNYYCNIFLEEASYELPTK